MRPETDLQTFQANTVLDFIIRHHYFFTAGSIVDQDKIDTLAKYLKKPNEDLSLAFENMTQNFNDWLSETDQTNKFKIAICSLDGDISSLKNFLTSPSNSEGTEIIFNNQETLKGVAKAFYSLNPKVPNFSSLGIFNKFNCKTGGDLCAILETKEDEDEDNDKAYEKTA